MGVTRFIRRLSGRGQWRPLVARRDTKTALRLSYLAFKELITSNDELLEQIAEVEKTLDGRTPFGMAFVRFRAVTCATHTYRMILCLDKLSARRYQELHPVFTGIQRTLEPILGGGPVAAQSGPLVYRIDEIDASRADAVGGKASNAGEVRNRAGLPVPDGFAVSTAAFATMLETDQLGDAIRAAQAGANDDDLQRLHEIAEDLHELITTRPVPPALAQAIMAAYDRLAERLGPAPRVSMRSSAVGEDGEISFAGQYVTVLNVTRDGLIDAYREVLAGLYTPRALFYRLLHGIPDEAASMAVLAMTQIDAAASGVACSIDPNRPAAGTTLVTGAWGLGLTTVDGSVSPDTWEVSREPVPAIARARLGVKDTRAGLAAGGGVERADVPPETAAAPCLSEAQVLEVARLARAAEAHFGRPQEVEWAADATGRLWLLQSRPLRVARAGTAELADVPPEIDGHARLLVGMSASPGCASGPVVHLAESDDPASFPVGGVLVARHSSPKFVKVMGRAAAIVTDVGATTGHMASLAREFGLPAVLDTRTATASLAPGRIVTVDANLGAVFDGRVDRLLVEAPAAPARTMKDTPVYAILRRVADAIVPLNLTDPRSPTFRPHHCRTFHDIARFAHEKAFEEMFRMSDRVADVTQRAVKLAERLPYELYLIDIGGGIDAQPSPSSTVRARDITSEPMQALLRGMMDPALRWWEPRGISLRGFLAVATESMMNPRYETGQRQIGDRSYAIVADAYCNFSSRIGYHFAAVDAYCGAQQTRNYVSFRFKGGAADDVRRAQRCELIEEVLRRLDFQVDRRYDLVNARLRKYPREAIAERLDQVGRLIVATRQLDMRMGPGTPIGWFVDAFFAGNYLFDPAESQPASAAGSLR